MSASVVKKLNLSAPGVRNKGIVRKSVSSRTGLLIRRFVRSLMMPWYSLLVVIRMMMSWRMNTVMMQARVMGESKMKMPHSTGIGVKVSNFGINWYNIYCYASFFCRNGLETVMEETESEEDSKP